MICEWLRHEVSPSLGDRVTSPYADALATKAICTSLYALPRSNGVGIHLPIMAVAEPTVRVHRFDVLTAIGRMLWLAMSG